VNPASPGSQPPAISYDPSGTRSASGLGDSYPFLYQGMESEVTEPYPFYYGGGGGFYNPQIQRGLSITGAQGTSGPGDSPGPGQASLPAVGSSSPNPFNPVSNLQLYEQSQSLGDIAGNGASDLVSALGLDIGTGPVGPIVQYAYFLAMWFDELFGGGSPDYPPNYFTFQFRLNRKHAGRHPLYTALIGMAPEIVPGTNGFQPASAGGGPSIDPLGKPEGSFEQAGYQQVRVVNMQPDQTIRVNNRDGSVAYQVKCQKNGTLTVDIFDKNAGHWPYRQGSATLTFMGTRTTYICRQTQYEAGL
jgi:hypothetical protein